MEAAADVDEPLDLTMHTSLGIKLSPYYRSTIIKLRGRRQITCSLLTAIECRHAETGVWSCCGTAASATGAAQPPYGAKSPQQPRIALRGSIARECVARRLQSERGRAWQQGCDGTIAIGASIRQ
jgi:hypothetical protein